MKRDIFIGFIFNIRRLIFIFVQRTPKWGSNFRLTGLLLYNSGLVDSVRSGAVGKNVCGSGMTWDSLGLISEVHFFFFNNPDWPGVLGSKILSGAIYEHVIAASALFCWGTYVGSGKSKEKLMPISNNQTLFMRSHRLLDGDHFPTWSRWYLGQPDIITSTKSDVFCLSRPRENEFTAELQNLDAGDGKTRTRATLCN